MLCVIREIILANLCHDLMIPILYKVFSLILTNNSYTKKRFIDKIHVINTDHIMKTKCEKYDCYICSIYSKHLTRSRSINIYCYDLVIIGRLEKAAPYNTCNICGKQYKKGMARDYTGKTNLMISGRYDITYPFDKQKSKMITGYVPYYYHTSCLSELIV
jgi:hypothetical protein